MKPVLKEVLSLIKEKKFSKLLEKILNKISKSVFSPFLFYDHFFILRYDCLGAASPFKRKNKVITTRIAAVSDLPKLNRLVDRDNDLYIRMQKSHICIVAELSDEIVGMKWVKFGSRHYEKYNGYEMRLPERSVWSYDAYVMPEYRNRGIWVNLTEEEVEYLASRSVENVFCMVKSLNDFSLRTHLRYKYKIEKEIIFFRILIFGIYLVKDSFNK
jgi:GNAT superfamily N-acetyltransferase